MKNNDTLVKIFVPVEIKRALQEEFKTTRTTVNLALMHVNNSEMAKSIRKKAKELLLQEVNKITD